MGRLLKGVFWLAWLAFVVAVPVLGVWLASSLVAFHGGPRWLAVAGDVVLFPLLPLLWEWRATAKWSQRLRARRQLGAAPKRHLTAKGRLVLRALVVSLLFVAALLVWFPKTAFGALATRGDWFLEGQTAPWAQTAREACWAAASGLEWLHKAANPNPYDVQGVSEAPVDVAPTKDARPLWEQPGFDAGARLVRWGWGRDAVTGAVAVMPRDAGGEDDAVFELHAGPDERPDGGTQVAKPGGDEGPGDSSAPASAAAGASWTVGDTVWPWEEKVHPAVAALSPDDEQSIESVGRSLAAREPDPFRRVKALHDYVATRLTYDQEAAKPGARMPPQDAQAVFARRTAVCAGYALLLEALGKATGDRVEYVVGEARKNDGTLESHAWNAVQVRGAWYLVDPTWDAPFEVGSGRQQYRTTYLFVPPPVALQDHLPKQAAWQLVERPLSRGDFLRQPPPSAGLARFGVTLTAPERLGMEVPREFEVKARNPNGWRVLAEAVADGRDRVRCGASSDPDVVLRCAVPSAGEWTAAVFIADAPGQSSSAIPAQAMVEVRAR